MTSFTHERLAQRVMFGHHHAIASLTEVVVERGSPRVLLIATDRVAGPFVAALRPVAHIGRVVRHVPAEEVEAALDVVKLSRAELIVSVGGGSATGLAKAIALRTGLPIIAIPTTFAGSEATPVWGITTSRRKETGVDNVVVPSTVIYDSDLFAELPADLAVTSAFNALAHGVDALWAPRADPLSDGDAEIGIRRIASAVRRLMDRPGPEATSDLLIGTYLSSVAFAASGSGMHHKLCHVLGGAYDLPHAPLHTVVLPHVVAFNLAAAPRARQILERAFDGEPVAVLTELISKADVPRSLREIGFREADIAEAAELCLAAIPASNPRSVDVRAIESLLRSAYAGPPTIPGSTS